MSAVRVGLIGLGTVGTGVARLLLERRSEIAARTGVDLELTAAVDLDASRAEGLGLPEGVFSTDAESVLGREDLEIVIELIGGLEPAGDFVRRALASGRSVVTANKHLLAERFGELSAAAREGGAELFFEAAVAGGIPILKSLREGLAANRLNAVMGIVNGTCNYILTEMTERGESFEKVLAAAQEAGYAETPPTLDVGGHDSAHKLALLAALGFDGLYDLKDIYVEGIEKITPADIRYAAEMGFVVKLLAVGRRAGEEVELRVHPTLLDRHHPLASVEGVFNAVLLETDTAGRLMFYGRGAGREPTASAVVADVIDAARWRALPPDARAARAAELSPRGVRRMEETRSRYFVRFNVADEFGVLGTIATELGRCEVSIQEVIQKEKRADGVVPVVMLTHPAREADFRSAIAALDGRDFVLEPTAFIRASVD
ncbi:MAG: homoserine dehydrogenase [Planctomycetota bacterium]